ncbi:PrgH/EprH family type III secretion apparatus protein [[Erwinia] mediterraneensis]|uniref:PrgH/EprH family type III secretion apparatus protein n=1 Tax=[Erwinia] mediterraneensis TaxID=2161819 RepID=UPI0010304519|nr:PrgH/EprH family type III secretion apparatus protein [[Erwinia] mediterraneensis]
MNNETLLHASSATLVVRLLNGVLRGCEYTLNAPTLFVFSADNDIVLQQQSSVLPDNVIYIPGAGDNNNFELIPPADNRDSVLIRELSESEAVEKTVALQQVTEVGNLVFAIRHHDTCWDKSVLDYQVMEMPARPLRLRKNGYFWPLMLSALLVASAAAGGWYFLNSPQRQVNEISALMGKGAGDYFIAPGRDKITYVVVSGQEALNWTRQTFIKFPPPGKVKVVNSAEEADRIAQWLTQHWQAVKFHRVDFSRPYRPVLWLSQERGQLTAQEEATLRAALLEQLPWAKNIVFSTVKDRQVAADAESGLSKIAQYFNKSSEKDSVTYLIHGELNDAELEGLKKFVTAFYQRWGNNYVSFAIELQDNPLKDKSFKYGDKGYIKLKPGHWFFAQPLYKENVKNG